MSGTCVAEGSPTVRLAYSSAKAQVDDPAAFTREMTKILLAKQSPNDEAAGKR